MEEGDEFTEEQIGQGRRFVMDWRDFVTCASTLPEYAVKGRNLICARLGYLPPTEMVYVPYEPFLRSLFAGYDNDRITGDVFLHEADDIIKNIRNDDLKKHGFANLCLTGDDYEYYETHLGTYKEAARKRLSQLLGYEPLLAHSLSAEVHLRQLIMEDYYHEELPPDKVDHRSFTIYHYTKAYANGGFKEADASPLLRIAG